MRHAGRGVAAPEGWWETGGTRIYEVHSGRQRVALQDASSAQEALFDYLRSLGCRDDEIVRLGAAAAAWRGAVYSVRRQRVRARTADPARVDSPPAHGPIARRGARERGRAAIVPAMDDLGAPSSYLALEPGVDVFSRDGEKLGELQHVLADFELEVFDGIVIDSSSLPGGLRFADAVQVAEIYERGVVLTLDSSEAERLPEPIENPGFLEVTGVEDVDGSEFREKLRRAWELTSGEGLDKHKS